MPPKSSGSHVNLSSFHVVSAHPVVFKTYKNSDWRSNICKIRVQNTYLKIFRNSYEFPTLYCQKVQGFSSYIVHPLQITNLNHKYFKTHLEDSLSLGKPLLIEDIGEELDPILDNLLDKNFIRQGKNIKVMLGDQEKDIAEGFHLMMTQWGK